MNRDHLRAAQEPLKERYRSEPADALITLHADGELGDGITCSVATGRAMAEAGLHQFADALQQGIGRLHDLVTETYFGTAHSGSAMLSARA